MMLLAYAVLCLLIGLTAIVLTMMLAMCEAFERTTFRLPLPLSPTAVEPTNP